MQRFMATFGLMSTLALGAGCAAQGDQTGEIQFALVASDQYQLFSLTPQNTTPSEVVSAVVLVDEIDARIGGSWTPIVTAPQTIDLLKLDHKTLNTIGVGKLPTGHIDELRLKLDEVGDYVVLKSGAKKPLEVPVNGIVKVVGKLDLDACSVGIVILDFDPHIKTEDEPGRREYELTCVAHIKTEEIKGACGPLGGGDMAHSGSGGNDMALCSGIVCPTGETCEVQNGVPVCVADPCSGVVCPTGQVCEVQNGVGVCVAQMDGGSAGPGGNADGGCMHH